MARLFIITVTKTVAKGWLFPHLIPSSHGVAEFSFCRDKARLVSQRQTFVNQFFRALSTYFSHFPAQLLQHFYILY